jgi:hypothetical protein
MLVGILGIVIMILVCVVTIQYRKVKYSRKSDGIHHDLVKSACRAMVNSQNTSSPVLALVDAYRGLTLLEAAMKIHTPTEDLRSAFVEFQIFTEEIRRDLDKLCDPNEQIVYNCINSNSTWS